MSYSTWLLLSFNHSTSSEMVPKYPFILKKLSSSHGEARNWHMACSLWHAEPEFTPWILSSVANSWFGSRGKLAVWLKLVFLGQVSSEAFSELRGWGWRSQCPGLIKMPVPALIFGAACSFS